MENALNRASTTRTRRTIRAYPTRGKTFIEFFAGIGLVHLGLKASGWKCIYANDISDDKYQMYHEQFPDAEAYFHLEDIWKTDEIAARLTEPVLLATASFPCTDLSVAGNYKGLNGTHSSTFFAFVNVLTKLKARHRQPSVVMLENVRGFLTSHGGKDYQQACTTLADLGYYLDTLLVDAKHFTPQSRPRVFVIALTESAIPKDAKVQGRKVTLGDPWLAAISSRPDIRPLQLQQSMLSLRLKTGWCALDVPPLPSEQRSLSSLIDLDDNQEWWDETAVKKHFDMMSDTHHALVEAKLASGENAVGTIFRRKRHGHMRSEVRFDGLAGCLRTPRGGSAKQIVIAIQRGTLRMRWMSPREYARLQGAPDFPISVDRNQALFGFGDAVCVPAIEWVDKHILSRAAETALRDNRDG